MLLFSNKLLKKGGGQPIVRLNLGVGAAGEGAIPFVIHRIHILQLGALEWIHLPPICISELPDSDNYLFTVRESGGVGGARVKEEGDG